VTVTPDGSFVDFVRLRRGSFGNSLWRVAFLGGPPKPIIEATQVTQMFTTGQLDPSPDGTSILFRSLDAAGHGVIVICDLPMCAAPRFTASEITERAGASVRWTPNGRGLAFVDLTMPNLWVFSLDGKPPRQLTHFTDDRTITDFAWSRDGKRLAIARGMTTNDIVLFKGLKR
jgi:Tol biopolymer transport system component